MTSELDDWNNLVKSPGWQRLASWATTEYGLQFQQQAEHAANERDDVQALSYLRQIIAAKKAVEFVVAYPAQRLKALEGNRQTEEPHPLYTRGGV